MITEGDFLLVLLHLVFTDAGFAYLDWIRSQDHRHQRISEGMEVFWNLRYLD